MEKARDVDRAGGRAKLDFRIRCICMAGNAWLKLIKSHKAESVIRTSHNYYFGPKRFSTHTHSSSGGWSERRWLRLVWGTSINTPLFIFGSLFDWSSSATTFHENSNSIEIISLCPMSTNFRWIFGPRCVAFLVFISEAYRIAATAFTVFTFWPSQSLVYLHKLHDDDENGSNSNSNNNARAMNVIKFLSHSFVVVYTSQIVLFHSLFVSCVFPCAKSAANK